MNSRIVDFQCILGSELLCADIALVAEGVWEVYGLNVVTHFHPLRSTFRADRAVVALALEMVGYKLIWNP